MFHLASGSLKLSARVFHGLFFKLSIQFFPKMEMFHCQLKKKQLETHSWSDVPLVLMYVSLSTCYQATRRITSGEPVVEYKGTLLSHSEAKVRPDLTYWHIVPMVLNSKLK